jgi:NAD dependent epimerase/dehydratase family enzyme
MAVRNPVPLSSASVGGTLISVGVPEAAKELKENTAIENSATSATTVYVSVLAKAEATVFEVISDGVSIFKVRKETLVAASDNFNFTFRIKIAGKWEVKTTEGKIESSTTAASVYSFTTG